MVPYDLILMDAQMCSVWRPRIKKIGERAFSLQSPLMNTLL